MRADHDLSVSGSVSRRRAITATAWSVPVISVAIAAPTAAASPTPGPGSIYVQTISLWGGGGQPAQGNFVVQAVSGVAGDTRTVVLTAVATLYRGHSGFLSRLDSLRERAIETAATPLMVDLPDYIRGIPGDESHYYEYGDSDVMGNAEILANRQTLTAMHLYELSWPARVLSSRTWWKPRKSMKRPRSSGLTRAGCNSRCSTPMSCRSRLVVTVSRAMALASALHERGGDTPPGCTKVPVL